MAIGSFLPWTSASLNGFAIHRNGMHLGANQTFSIDGLICIFLGVSAAIIGFTFWSQVKSPRWLCFSAMVNALVGLAVVLYYLTNAIDYTSAVKVGLVGVNSSVDYGIWIVIAGAALITVAAITSFVTWKSGCQVQD